MIRRCGMLLAVRF